MALLRIEPYIVDSVSNFVFNNATVTSNLTSGNASLGNLAIANYFSGSGANLTSLPGANVTGAVAYATTANAVAVANVTGIGNIATINKDGNASNILYGNGTFAAAPVTYGNSNVATYLPTYTGNLSPGNISISASNLHITGGNANYVLQTDGTGNLTWAASAAGGGVTTTIDAFTGNGVQTDFTLSTTPTDANYTIAVVHGMVQPKSTYSVSGNVLTFSSAPASSALVEITTLSGGSGGGGGSSVPLGKTVALNMFLGF